MNRRRPPWWAVLPLLLVLLPSHALARSSGLARPPGRGLRQAQLVLEDSRGGQEGVQQEEQQQTTTALAAAAVASGATAAAAQQAAGTQASESQGTATAQTSVAAVQQQEAAAVQRAQQQAAAAAAAEQQAAALARQAGASEQQQQQQAGTAAAQQELAVGTGIQDDAAVAAAAAALQRRQQQRQQQLGGSGPEGAQQQAQAQQGAAQQQQQQAQQQQQPQAGELSPVQLLAEQARQQQQQAGLAVPEESEVVQRKEALARQPHEPDQMEPLVLPHHREAQRQLPRDPSGLFTFENDPVPAQVGIQDYQHEGRPEELSSSSFLTENATAPNYVAMCLVVRDQQDDIVEWVHHHLRLGISKIYVFDNGSDPPLWQVLQKYMLQGVVVYEHFTTFNHTTDRPQLYAYDRCLHDYGHRHSWMVFIDVDEFLVFKEGPPVQSLPDFLKQFERYSGLGVHWILFGSSGHTTRPSKGVLRSYYKCLPLMHSQHTLIKTIANTRCTTGAWGPHAFHHNCSLPVVRPNHEAIYGPRADRPQYGRLALHHYATKSLEEFRMKMKRGSGMRRQRGMEYFWFVDAWSVDYNFDGMRIWDDITSYQHYPAVQALQGRYDNLPVHAWNQ